MLKEIIRIVIRGKTNCNSQRIMVMLSAIILTHKHTLREYTSFEPGFSCWVCWSQSSLNRVFKVCSLCSVTSFYPLMKFVD